MSTPFLSDYLPVVEATADIPANPVTDPGTSTTMIAFCFDAETQTLSFWDPIAEERLEIALGAGGGGPADTDALAEGVTNLYFTDERAQDAVGLILSDGTTVNFAYNDGVPSITAEVQNIAVAHFAADVVDDDDTLAADSAMRIPTQAAVKGYVDAAVGGAVAAEDLLDTQTVSGVAAITWNGAPIPTTTYRKLRVEFVGTSSFAAAQPAVNCRVNNDSGANYDMVMQQVNNGTQQANSGVGLTSISSGISVGSTGTADKVGTSKWEFLNFLSADHKVCTCEGHAIPTTTASAMFTRSGYALWRNTAAITRLDLTCNSGGNLSGVAKLYGVR